MKPEEAYKLLEGWLKVLRRKKKLVRTTRGLLSAGALCSFLASASLALEGLLYLPPWAKWTLLSLGCATGASSLAVLVLLPLLRRVPLEAVSREVEEAFPELRDELTASLQLWPRRERNPEGYSVAMIEALVRNVAERLKEVNMGKLVGKVGREALIFGTSVLALASASLLWPGAYLRLSNPGTRFLPPDYTRIEVSPGDTTVVEGGDCEVRVRLEGKLPREVVLYTRESGVERWEEADVPTGGRREVSYRFRALKDSVLYRVRAGEAESPVYTISVLKRPFVRKIRVFLSFPRYTGFAPAYEEGGEVRAIVGTEVRVEVVANKPLGRATLKFEKGEDVQMEVEGQKAEGNFVVRRGDTYRVCVWDTLGVPNLDPIPYPVVPMRDEPPSVVIRFPKEDYELGEDMEVPLKVEAEDDFGVRHMRLAYRREGTEQVSYIPLEVESGGTKAEVAYLWDVGPLNLIPGDRVVYWAEAWDNDEISGPKMGRSKEHFLRFPSVEELFAKWEEEREIASDALSSLSRESGKLRRRAGELRRKLLRKEEMDWETRKEAEEVARRMEEASKALRKLSERWEASAERMARAEALLRDTLEKLRRIGELLREALPSDLRKALEEVRRALEGRDPEELRKALERMDFSLEEFRRSLDRTLSLLERMKAQAEMDALIRSAEELAERQDEVLRRAEEDPLRMAGEEARIRDEVGNVEGRLRELSESLREHAPSPWEEVGALADSLRMWDTKGKACRAAEALGRGDLNGAMGPGKQVRDDMESLAEELSSLRRKLAEGWRAEVLAELRRAIRDLGYITSGQEELLKEDLPKGKLSVLQGELAEGLRSLEERLYKVSGKTFLVPAGVGASLRRALKGMREATKLLEEGRPPVAAKARMRVVLPQLRRGLWLLYLAQRQAEGSPGGMGTERMLAELRRIAQAQRGINRGTQSLLKRTEPSKEVLDRLAAEQAAVRRALEELLRRARGRAGTLGRLDRVAEDMRKVEKDLRKGKVDEDTRARQERILSRLLDAQRSIHKRGFARRREARRPGEYRTVSPGPLPSDLLGRDEWEAFVREVLKETPEEYRTLVRQYLEAMHVGR